MKNQTFHVIFFDGECAFCSRLIVYLIKKDKNDYFRFASLNSSFAKKTLNSLTYAPDSIILYLDDKFYFKSEAVLMILKKMNIFIVFRIIYGFFPRKIRDWMYDFFAKYRHVIFGKQKYCIVPSKEIRQKILE